MKRLAALSLALILLLVMIPTAAAGGFEVTTYQELLKKLDSNESTIYIDESLAQNGDFGWPAGPVTLTVSKTLNPMTAWTVPEQITLRLVENGQVTGDTLIMKGTLDVSQSQRGSTFPVQNLDLQGQLLGKGNELKIGSGSSVTLNGGTLENFTRINLLGTLAGAGVLDIPVNAKGLQQSNPSEFSHPVLSGSFTLVCGLTVGDANCPQPAELTIPETSAIRCMDKVSILENSVLKLDGSLEIFGKSPDESPDMPANSYRDGVRLVKNGRLTLGSSGLLSLRDRHMMVCLSEPYGWENVEPTVPPCVTGTGTIRYTQYYASPADNGCLLFDQWLSKPSDRELLDNVYLDPAVQLDLQLHPTEELLLEELRPVPDIPAFDPNRSVLEDALNAPDTSTSGMDALGSTGFIQDLAHEPGVAKDSLHIQLHMSVTDYQPTEGLTLDLTPQVVLTKDGKEETRSFPVGSTGINQQPITLSVRLPQGMMTPTHARHFLPGGGIELLPVTVDNGVATWRQSSFSPVTLFRDSRRITLRFPDIAPADQLQTYTAANVGDELPPVPEQSNLGGWYFILDGKWSKSTYSTLTDQLLTQLCEAETVDVQWLPLRENVYVLKALAVKGGVPGAPFPQGPFTVQATVDSRNHFDIWDDLLLAAYDANGRLLDFAVTATPKTVCTTTIDLPVDPHTGDVALIKLFALPRYGCIVPLSDTIELRETP